MCHVCAGHVLVTVGQFHGLTDKSALIFIRKSMYEYMYRNYVKNTVGLRVLVCNLVLVGR